MGVLMTRKSCAVGMRNAILRNYLKQHIPSPDTTRKSSQDESSSATYRSQTAPEIEVHEGVI